MGLGDSSFEAPEAGEMADNVYMDMTCCGGEGVIERAIKRLGSGKFVWGTDVPYGNFIGEFFKLLSLQISDDDKMKILWDNPMRIYRL
jgi:predicted TIM-barrel fold metal-dependent hydrolase